MPVKPIINYEDFEKLDLRIAKIISAEEIKESNRLVKLIVDIGEEQRQLIAGIKGSCTTEELVGRLVIVLVNLAPKTMMGYESKGMILAGVNTDGKAVLISPLANLVSGTPVR